jgi:hypothetical protein
MTEESRPNRTGQAGKSQASRSGGTSRESSPRDSARRQHPEPRWLRSHPDRYLVTAWPPGGPMAGDVPAALRAVTTELEQDESCRVVRRLGGSLVAEMSPEHAVRLASGSGLLLEPDLATEDRGSPALVTAPLLVDVTDDARRPVDGAAVTAGPVTAFTDSDGQAELTVAPVMLTAMQSLMVRPPGGYWPAVLNSPLAHRAATGRIRVTCTRLTTTFPEFPERALDSWGARAMGFTRLPPTHRGHGVRIVLIGSGATAGHPDLSGQLEHGHDIVGQDEKSWQEDLLGTGTHQATLIAGRDDGTGLVGLAPDAQLHVCRVTPGGSAADLIDALDYAIDQQADVVMFGTGLTGPSMLLAAAIDAAWRAGVVCVAPAGAFPAGLPQVLTVDALGQLGTFPPDSTDGLLVTAPLTPEGFFVPRFGQAPSLGQALPRVDCCAPGVAVISGLPPASYGPLSNAGAAAAHITALIALVLAHHPMFRSEPGRPPVRDASRPARLAELIRASCRPLPLDPARVGAGLPDAAVALGVAPYGAYPQLPLPYPAPVPGPEGLVPLEPLTAAMRAAGLLPA